MAEFTLAPVDAATFLAKRGAVARRTVNAEQDHPDPPQKILTCPVDGKKLYP
ncbi:hypothetical protein [Rhabdonatronobacter sediminivivens]|uniref:hypothetical protein n=1 Tax=Rhabdonatronobacter sediminivivens TaxID=2743469 RepID=UPI0015CFE8EB|nr:hypothetical protein [Rhabdonatronobacter sediminivivens]